MNQLIDHWLCNPSVKLVMQSICSTDLQMVAKSFHERDALLVRGESVAVLVLGSVDVSCRKDNGSMA